jgi:phosphosulfolactate phosphohydrolase-like enzyme
LSSVASAEVKAAAASSVAVLVVDVGSESEAALEDCRHAGVVTGADLVSSPSEKPVVAWKG